MSLRYIGVATLALLGNVYGADSCCFVAQDEAHEVYWAEYATDVYTVTVNSSSTIVATSSVLANENPVALYPNPAFTVPQKTEILDTSAPTKTGGLTIASPTGFWAYSTVKVYVAAPVTDANGNVACGTLSSFSKAPTDPAACVPTFTGINSNAAAYFRGNNRMQAVEISLTTPFIHVPTRPALKIGPSEACVQGSGAENYGYPVQQLIDHLAGNEFYSSQYPGIENCLPAGPSIQRLAALAATTESPTGGGLLDPTTATAAASTEVPGTDTGLTTITTSTTDSTTSPTTTTSETSPSVPESTPTTLTTSTTAGPTALPQSDTSTTSSTTSAEVPFSDGGLLPGTTTTTTPVASATPESAVTTPESSTAPTAAPMSNGEPETTETSTVSVVPLPAGEETTTTSELPTSTDSPTSIDSPISTESPTSTDSPISTESPTSTDSLPASATSADDVAPTDTADTPVTSTESSDSQETSTSTEVPAVSNGTATVAPGGTPTPGDELTSSGIKGHVVWELMTGLAGLTILGFW